MADKDPLRRDLLWSELHDLLARGWHVDILTTMPPGTRRVTGYRGNPEWRGKGDAISHEVGPIDNVHLHKAVAELNAKCKEQEEVSDG